jgi:hypothetical protein
MNSAIVAEPFGQLKNVHEVLGESRFEPEPETKQNCTFRVEPSLETEARQICEQNGSDLSKYLRGCVRQLVADYR